MNKSQNVCKGNKSKIESRCVARKSNQSQKILQTISRSKSTTGDIVKSQVDSDQAKGKIESRRDFNEKEDAKNVQSKIMSDSLIKMVIQEGSIETLLGPRKSSNSLYDVDKMTPKQLQNVLHNAKECPIQPFSFLKNILNNDDFNEHSSFESSTTTDIDVQLTALMRRIELNKVLLESTNKRVKEIDFLMERKNIPAVKDNCYDEDIFLKMKESNTTDIPREECDIEHPGIDELRQTMNATMDMLKYVKRVSKGEISCDDVPKELLTYVDKDQDDICKTEVDQVEET